MLRDAPPGGGGHERAHGRDIEAVRAIAAGPDDIDRVARHGNPYDDVAERRRTTRYLVDRLAADVERREERAKLRRRGLAGHHRRHRRARLVAGERATGGDGPEGLTRVQGNSPACASRRLS